LVRIERRLEELVLNTAAHAGAWEPVARGGGSSGARESVQYVNHAAAALATAFLESAAGIIGRENEFYAGLASLAGALGISDSPAQRARPRASTLADVFAVRGTPLPENPIDFDAACMLQSLVEA
jgi:hypothetical protein